MPELQTLGNAMIHMVSRQTPYIIYLEGGTGRTDHGVKSSEVLGLGKEKSMLWHSRGQPWPFPHSKASTKVILVCGKIMNVQPSAPWRWWTAQWDPVRLRNRGKDCTGRGCWFTHQSGDCLDGWRSLGQMHVRGIVRQAERTAVTARKWMGGHARRYGAPLLL
jgi:hypothetical protein